MLSHKFMCLRFIALPDGHDMARFNIWGAQMTLQGRTFEELWLKF